MADTQITGAESGVTSDDRSTARLVKDLSEQTSHLVRAEARLAVREMTVKAKRGAAGGVFTGIAAVAALYGGGALVAFLVLLLALALPAWAAAVIVTGALFLVAGLAALIGYVLLKRAVPPVPEETISSVRSDVETVREGASR